MTNLNFSISELVYSDTAVKHNINNMPDLRSLDNLLNLIFYCLQPLRDKIAKPIIISSGYRCAEVNRLVGGASNSQHLSGQAVDFIVKGMQVDYAFNIICKSQLVFDQLVNEHNKWIHISFNKNLNRRQILKFT